MTRFSAHTWMRLPLPETEPGALFGASVAVCAETIVVGAPSKDHAGALVGQPDVGRAYAFAWDGTHWAPTATLKGPESRGGLFGAAVATDGRHIAVGGPRARVHGTQHAGHVLIFRRAAPDAGQAWQSEVRLVDPHGPEPDEGFGAALALHGELLVVGAPLEVSGAGPPGVVHTFRLERGGGWRTSSSSHPRWREGPDAEAATADRPGSLFGRHLSLDGTTLAAAQDTWGGAPALAACFELARDGWSGPMVIRPPAGVEGPGAGLCLHGGWLAVGVPTSPAAGVPRAGVVCLFERSVGGHGAGHGDGHGASWRHRMTLHAPDPMTGQRFGEAVALHGGTLVVGAPGQRVAGQTAVGAAHVFELTPGPALEGPTWAHSLAFQPAGDDDRVAWSRLGEAVAVGGETVVVGAPGADPTHGGAAFVIEPA